MGPNIVGRARRLPGALLLAGAVSGLLAAPTVAAGANSVQVHVASTDQSGVSFQVRLRGHAAHDSTLYLFLDYRRCLKSPAAEHGPARKANGFLWDLTPGHFSKSEPWKARVGGRVHACAYLVKGIHYHAGSRPGNPRHGVVAHAFATFTVK